MFSPHIYSDWMKEIQDKKYEGIFIDFILPLKSELNFSLMRILDLGIGKGWFEDKLRERGLTPEIIGIDKDIIKPKKGLKRLVADGNYLPFKDEVFDFVISIDVLHLIKNTEEISRVIKKRGMALLGIFSNPYDLEEKRERFLRKIKNLKLIKESVVGDPKKEISYVGLFKKGPWSSG